MAKEKKGFFKEFKEFITRGNVFDMAVGIIIGGAFTAIVTALTNQILMPVINWILFLITGGKGLENIYTYLHKAFVEGSTTEIDLANSIYIDWGAFLTAIINFILIALVLFLIVRAVNHVHERAEAIKAKKAEEEAAAEAEAAKAAEEAAAAEAAAQPAPEPVPTTEDLLAEIRDLLKNQQK